MSADRYTFEDGDICDEGRPMHGLDPADRLNEQDDDLAIAGATIAQQQAEIAGLRAQIETTLTCTVCHPEHDLHITCSGCSAEATRRYDYCDACARDVQRLREQLASADEHIGALTKELETAIEWIQERGTTAAKYAPTAKEIVPQLFAAATAARAFLRRRAAR